MGVQKRTNEPSCITALFSNPLKMIPNAKKDVTIALLWPFRIMKNNYVFASGRTRMRGYVD